MKKGKFSRFILGSAAVAGAAVGAYYLYKNFMNKDYTDDFDDFDDDFDDDFFDEITVDDVEDTKEDESTREYVSININSSSDEGKEDGAVEEDKLAAEADTESKDVEEKQTTEEDVVAEEVDTDATVDINDNKDTE